MAFVSQSINSGGGGNIHFTAMSALEWNGFNTKTLSANIDVTIGTATSGVLLITNGASYTFKVYGVAVVIRNSGTNGGRTTVSYVIHSNGKLWVESDADDLPIEITIPVPDVTPPTVTFVATSTTNIRATFSEAMSSVTTAGMTFNNGGTITPSSVANVSGNIYDYTVAGLAVGQTITASYNPATGNTLDAGSPTPNELATITAQAVTNSIPSIMLLGNAFSDNACDGSVLPCTAVTGTNMYILGFDPYSQVQTPGNLTQIKAYINDILIGGGQFYTFAIYRPASTPFSFMSSPTSWTKIGVAVFPSSEVSGTGVHTFILSSSIPVLAGDQIMIGSNAHNLTYRMRAELPPYDPEQRGMYTSSDPTGSSTFNWYGGGMTYFAYYPEVELWGTP